MVIKIILLTLALSIPDKVPRDLIIFWC